MWIALVVAVVLVGLTVAAIFGRVDGSLVDPTSSLSYAPLPDGPLSPDDVQGLRLDTGLRGYRMEQVDEVIDRLTAEITVLRDQIDAATTAAYQPGPDADPGMPPASPFVRPSEWAEFSEPNARPDSQA